MDNHKHLTLEDTQKLVGELLQPGQVQALPNKLADRIMQKIVVHMTMHRTFAEGNAIPFWSSETPLHHHGS